MQPINLMATVKLHSQLNLEQSQYLWGEGQRSDTHSYFPTRFLRHVFVFRSVPLELLTLKHYRRITTPKT